MRDALNAFCDHGKPAMPLGSGEGPLSRLTFAVKDNVDVAGFRTGAGNPAWLESHPVAERTAPFVQSLLDAGALLVGKTIMDELAFSLLGQNVHYGTPVNPRAPGRIPGGSSSGSAAAAAGGLVDFALGTDTAGSVRVPAGFCGLHGLRLTHGRIPLEGVVPLAPSFDALGVLSRDPVIMRRVCKVLLGSEESDAGKGCFVIADDAWNIADEAVRAALQSAIDGLVQFSGPIEHVTLSRDGLDAWARAFSTVQRREIWSALGAWIDAAKPSFGPGVAERFAKARLVSSREAAAANEVLDEAREVLGAILGDRHLLCIPTAPCVALPIGASSEAQSDFRERAIRLTCIASLAGLPQLSLPLAEVEGLPCGISVIAGRGRDRDLLSLLDEIPPTGRG